MYLENGVTLNYTYVPIISSPFISTLTTRFMDNPPAPSNRIIGLCSGKFVIKISFLSLVLKTVGLFFPNPKF